MNLVQTCVLASFDHAQTAELKSRARDRLIGLETDDHLATGRRLRHPGSYTLERLPFCGPGSRFARPERRTVGQLGGVRLGQRWRYSAAWKACPSVSPAFLTLTPVNAPQQPHEM